MPREDLTKETLTGRTVTLTVGPSATPFPVHVELLCACSIYFAQVFTDRNVVPPDHHLQFLDEDVDAFAEFVRWAYTGHLQDYGESADPGHVVHLCRVWSLADVLRAEGLKVEATGVLESLYRQWHGKGSVVAYEAIDYVYTQTGSGSELREFVTRIWMERGTREDLNKVSTERKLPNEFLRDLSAALLADRASPTRLNIGGSASGANLN
ncbi:hypothetical protein BJX61DRAFT_447269 [Aspergillus egyptiacus]|nr:hypothetical protein BJX61DRAFT_447269 [Aspergillus egyptiacus]